MKICIVSEIYPHHPDCSGGEFSAHFLARGLAKAGNQVYVATIRYSCSHEFENLDGVNVCRIFDKRYGHDAQGKGLLFLLRAGELFYRHVRKKLTVFVKEEGIDILHGYNPTVIVPTLDVARRFGLISSMTVNEQFMACGGGMKHLRRGKRCDQCSLLRILSCIDSTDHFMKNKLLAVYYYRHFCLYTKVARKVNYIFCVSHDVEDRLRERGFKNTFVVFNIAEPGSVKEVDRDLKCASKVIFISSNISDEAKGYRVFKEAAALCPDYTFIAVGDDGDGVFKDRANIRHLGKLGKERLKEVLSRADVVAIPSICPDALPRVGLEALSAGKPIIGSDIGGIPDIVQDGRNGYLFEAGNGRQLAARIKDVLTDADKLAEMGQQSRRIALSRFSEGGITERIMGIYRGEENIEGPKPGIHNEQD